MNVSYSKLIATLAVSTLLAQFAVAQGNPAQDIAPTGGVSQITLKPGASRGVPEGANVIYDNGPYINAPGGGAGGLDASVLQSASRAHNIIGYSVNGASTVPTTTRFHLADDFTVPAGQMWYVQSVKVWLYRTSSVGLVWDDAVVQVWNGDPTAGGVVVFGNYTTNRLVASTFDSSYRVTETTLPAVNRELHEVEIGINQLFKPGTYWIEWGVNLLATPTGTVFAPPITINGVDNTGNGKQALITAAGAVTWTNLLMNGPGGLNAHPQGMPFRLCGEIACCWEPNIGASLGHGDDSITNGLALPFNFPMPGALPGGATTNVVSVCSNGFVGLGGVFAADFTPTVAEFTAQPARIAVPWDDYFPPGGGTVHWTTTPMRGIATWLRVDTFSGLTTQSILQLQMFPNGAFTISCWLHEPVTLRTPVFGVSAGLGAASVAIDATAGHIGVPGTATIYESFVSGSSDLSGNLFCFIPKNDGVAASYDIAVSRACCTFASSVRIAPGCFGMTTNVVSNLIAGGVGETATLLPPGTIGQVTLLGLVPAPFFIDLTPFGAPGCAVHHTNDLFSLPMSATGQTLIPLPCLAVLLGFPVGVQGVAIVPGINPLNVAVGDGWAMTIGNL
ncbi:MAG: hypothetical protein HZB39_15995 [Planctomycetes bacterium]|nr:hypothetical protein [Planctomycetota bacterium]